MVVVQDQHALPFARNDGVDDRGQDAPQVHLWRGAQELGDLDQLGDGTQGMDETGNEITTEGDRIIIARVQSNPGDGRPAGQERLGPLCQESGLPIPGRRADQDHAGAMLGAERVEKAGAGNPAQPRRRHTQLREDEG